MEQENILKRLITRHQKVLGPVRCLKSGIRGFITITILAALASFSQLPLLIAPFAASCITIYTNPSQDFAQPINVLGGYFVATLIGLLFVNFLPHQWWTLGIMVGSVISIQAYLRITHPPSGSVPLLIYFYREEDNMMFVLLPTIIGSMALLVIALLLMKIFPAKGSYPK